MVDPNSGVNKVASEPRRVLSLFDSVCIIVGTIIGAGIFETAPRVASQLGSFGWMILVWVVGGVLSLIGSLCFAELMSRYNDRVGGDYIYLGKAYSRPIAFLFAWAAFWIIRPGNIGAMAFTFGKYLSQIISHPILPWTTNNYVVFAIVAILALTTMNLIGLSQSKWIQNVLTVAKIVGILGIILLAILNPFSGEVAPVVRNNMSLGVFWLALIMVMYTYGGWNDIAFVAGEVKEPQKNLFRSMVYGTLTVTALYVMINWAFVLGLGFTSMAASKAVATDLVTTALGRESATGQMAGQLISALVCISCLGAINGMIITSPRIYYAVGRDYQFFQWLAAWNRQRNVPWQAISLQALVTVVLIGVCTYVDRGDDPFLVIFVVTAPYFWFFLGLVGLSVIVLRLKKNDTTISFRVPGYPIPPLILSAICFALVWAAWDFLVKMEFWFAAKFVAAMMAAGIVFAFFLERNESSRTT